MRLTERVIDEDGIEHIFTKYVKDNQKLKDEKLCQLEDIEDELGIDLITLFKALKNGIWVKIFPKLKNGGSIIRTGCSLSIVEIGGGVDKSFGLRFYVNNRPRYLILDTRKDNDLKDYGKTWALTKEELE